LDCCHAGGLPLGCDEDEGAVALRDKVSVTDNMNCMGPFKSDKTRGPTRRTSGFYSPQDTYVLLAACSDGQEAYETSDGGGVFTNALLQTLSAQNCHAYSYTDVMRKLSTLVG